jgi:hypothetical protein
VLGPYIIPAVAIGAVLIMPGRDVPGSAFVVCVPCARRLLASAANVRFFEDAPELPDLQCDVCGIMLRKILPNET